MKTLSVLLLLFVTTLSFGQTGSFDVEAYTQFLQTHQEMSAGEVLSLHPAGTFLSKTPAFSANPLYLDSIVLKYDLTENEQSLIRDNGFMVTENRAYPNFAQAYLDVWHKDLPVFVTTDAMLHALHSSYDAILKNIEMGVIIPTLTSYLNILHQQMNALDSIYAGNPSMREMLKDVDVYLTVSRTLLLGDAQPYYSENNVVINELINLVSLEIVGEYPLFSSVNRTIDFSQFKVRGHYTDEDLPQLGRYFKTMMWLGRTEFYLYPPQSASSCPPEEDIQRQIIDAALLVEASERGQASSLYSQIDSMIQFFVGESDNVTIPNMQQLLFSLGVTSPDALLDTTLFKRFQDTLLTAPFAFQRILSQILFTDPMNPETIQPASSFLLFGQRFIIDSYITSQVVFDKIHYQGSKVLRLLPSTLDVLFALGNDGAAQLLQPELDAYHYGSNLSAVRYLVDAYDSTFWQSNLFNLWLNCIRALNPPSVRTTLPDFMQSAAWWQEKMNTQLSSWTELRHDNLLYAKQSYTGGIICSYPYGYVEPIPAFYEAMKTFAEVAERKFQTFPFLNQSIINSTVNYFRLLKNVSDTLAGIARKELSQTPLSLEEKHFLQTMVSEVTVCGTSYHGWYYRIYYTGEESFLKQDYLVADIHTTPTDEGGQMVGWVKHVGTGPINLGVFVAPGSSGEYTAYVGATMSYREFSTSNFLRLSDEEWKSSYLFSSTRPSFVNLYLADTSGNAKPVGANLFMSPAGVAPPSKKPAAFSLQQNYPNPFNAGTLISISISSLTANEEVELSIYNTAGQKIRTLVKQTLPGGNYVFRWDGKDAQYRDVSSGVYFYELRVGSAIDSRKMTILR